LGKLLTRMGLNHQAV